MMTGTGALAARFAEQGCVIVPGKGGAESLSLLPRVCFWLFLVDVVVLFAVPGGLLWEFGLNYNGLTGAAASKIHPATYIAVATFGLLLLARPNPAAIISILADRERGALAMLAAAGVGLALAVIYARPGVAGLVDTFILPALLVIITAEIGGQTSARAEPLLHVLLGCNALLTIYEFATGIDVIPFRFEGVTMYDVRPSGLQGIAVENAVITGTYLAVLLAGGGNRISSGPRVVMAVLQSAALVACGERAAVVLAAVMLCLHAGCATLYILAGARVGRLGIGCFAAGAPLAVIVLYALWDAGAFDSLSRRFYSDGGSAMARMQMLALFARLPLHELLIAPDFDTVESMRRAYGLELGIENPIVRFILYHGALTTVVLTAGLVCLLRRFGRGLRPGYGWPLFYFLVIIMSYESIGSKTMVIAKLAALMTAMFQPSPGGRASRKFA